MKRNLYLIHHSSFRIHHFMKPEVSKMFCPRCAAQNTDDAKFCRSCGTDISLVPQAVTGVLAQRLAAEDESFESRVRRRRDRKLGKPVSIERAVRGFFMGLAFIFVAFSARMWAPAGNIWWFWLLIPAFGSLADGVSTYLRLAEEKKKPVAPPFYTPPQTAVPPVPPRASELPQMNTGEIIPPASVTEGTTRHLGVPVERARREE
jgi:ribosomal protein L40E